MTLLLPSNVSMLGAGIDLDCARWIAAVGQSNVTQPRGRLVSDTIRELKAAAVWADLDFLPVLCAENAASALVDWKARKVMTATASPTFTADRGYLFDGAANYLATGFTPSTDCVAATGTSFMLGAYERVNLASSGNNLGAANSSTQTARIISRTAGNVFLGNMNAAAVNFATSLSTSVGLSVVTTDGTNGNGYKNGALSVLSPLAWTTPGSSLTSREVFIGCYNNNGVAAGFRASTMGYALFGRGSWTATQHAQFYTIMQRFMTKLGANV